MSSVLLVVFATAAVGIEAAEQSDVAKLATCAAYFFNATNARPMSEYEELHEAGVRAVNRMRRLVDRERADRLIGDASISMTALTGGDWRRFDRLQSRYGADCDALVGDAR